MLDSFNRTRHHDESNRALLSRCRGSDRCSGRSRSAPDSRTGSSHLTQERFHRGVIWLVSGFLFCPCHLPVTLWLIGSFLTAGALGNTVQNHKLALSVGITIVWLLPTIRGIWLMRNPTRDTHCRGSHGLRLLILLAVPALNVSAQQPPPRTAEDSLRAAEYTRKDALLSADTVLLSRLTASEFYEVNRFGLLRTRASNMQDIASGALKLHTITLDSLAVRVYGNMGILTGIADNTGDFHGMQFSGKVRYTRVFVRRDGRWQAVLMQHTPMS